MQYITLYNDNKNRNNNKNRKMVILENNNMIK